MFAWYRDAKFCLAYLGDAFIVEEGDGDRWRYYKKWILSLRIIGFNHARWFKRGWTLQERIAPKEVLFFDRNWEFIGTRTSLAHYIAEITRIDKSIFEENGLGRMAKFSVANRLSWAAKREVTREEDRAYSLMGLFGVNMPIIYGEGETSAFFRLQQEIFSATGDHSIFAWLAIRSMRMVPISLPQSS